VSASKGMKASRAVFVVACNLLFLGPAFPAHAASDDVSLTIAGPHGETRYTRQELLARADLTGIRITHDVAYARRMRYEALPLTPLLQSAGITPDSSVRFVARDGFVAILPGKLLLGQPPAHASAYLAIEPADWPWPPLKSGALTSAGPFYLVWLRPERSGIGPEQWPYQIARLEVVLPIAQRFPAILPSPMLPAASPVRRGLLVFERNCLPCHTLNREGDATVGPDLNVPMNPTEYFRPDALAKLIRNPRQVRSWKEARMPAFDLHALPDAELQDLLTYLRYMAKRRVPSVQQSDAPREKLTP
jgi:mono/diheme cytochrome c family protein